jgi:ABC-type multidrug transport system fused ATPase/permease subunit
MSPDLGTRQQGTLAKLLALLRRDADGHVRRHLALALSLVVISGLLAALAPLALKTMVDAVSAHGPASGPSLMQTVLTAGAAYIAALCGARVLADLGPLHTGLADQRLDRHLTDRFFAHLLQLPMATVLQRRSGEFVRSLDLASSGCRVVVGHAVNSVAPALAETAMMATVLLQLDQPALLVALAGTAVLYLVVFAVGARRMARQSVAVSVAHLELHALLADHLQHNEVLRCFTAEALAQQRIAAASMALEQSWQALHRLRTRIALAITATFTMSVVASLVLAAHAVAQGTLTVGGFVLATVYMLQVVRPLELLGSAVRDIAQALGFVRPLLDILREPVEAMGAPETHTPPSRAPGKGPSIRFERLVFGYHTDRLVLQGLDLEIPAGHTVAIVGASGSGKSSLVRLLLRLVRPQSGRILLDGVPIDCLRLTDLRGCIGLVPQDTALFHDSIAGNIALGRPGATADAIAQAATDAQLGGLIAALPAGLATPVGERGLQFSGGERQRIAIARALLRQPALCVFDEATSMLDSRTEAALMQSLRRLSVGRTTLLIAHRLSTVVTADQIVVLDQGRVAEQGRHAELLARGGLYAALWRQQTGRAP